MSKFLRIISTFMVITGLVFLFAYVRSLDTDNADLLNQPSYYVVRNYWFMFVAGIITIVFSILGSFFSWFKIMDPGKEALPNAGYATSDDISTWIAGTTADTGEETVILTEKVDLSADDQTEILYGSETFSEKTEILHEPEISFEETEILTNVQDSDGLKTEILREEDTQ